MHDVYQVIGIPKEELYFRNDYERFLQAISTYDADFALTLTKLKKMFDICYEYGKEFLRAHPEIVAQAKEDTHLIRDIYRRPEKHVTNQEYRTRLYGKFLRLYDASLFDKFIGREYVFNQKPIPKQKFITDLRQSFPGISLKTIAFFVSKIYGSENTHIFTLKEARNIPLDILLREVQLHNSSFSLSKGVVEFTPTYDMTQREHELMLALESAVKDLRPLYKLSGEYILEIQEKANMN